MFSKKATVAFAIAVENLFGILNTLSSQSLLALTQTGRHLDADRPVPMHIKENKRYRLHTSYFACLHLMVCATMFPMVAIAIIDNVLFSQL